LPSDFTRKAAQYLQDRVRVAGFSGAVLVAHDGQPVLRQACGLADHELDIPNTPATRFRLGSVTKQFTAAAILLLEQRGRLGVSDPVDRHLTDWPPAWKEVTIHHLLSHRAGLPRLTTQAMLDVSALSRSTPAPFQGVRDLMKPGEESQPLDSKPGEKFAYSNIGYIVLGMVIEKVSGKTFCSFLAEDVFQPLEMTDTGCEDPTVLLKQRARGYTRLEGSLANAGYVDVRFTGAARALYSTLDDLLVSNHALDSDALLNSVERERLFTPVTGDHACGWWIQSRFGHKVQWHGGNVSGFVAHIARYPAEHLFIVVLSNVWSNRDRSQVRAMANELSAIAFGEPHEPPRERKEIALDSQLLDACVGEYTGKDTFAIAREGQRMMLQFPPGQSVMELFPESPTQFFAKVKEYYLDFEKDETGKVTHVVVVNEGETDRWMKSR